MLEGSVEIQTLQVSRKDQLPQHQRLVHVLKMLGSSPEKGVGHGFSSRTPGARCVLTLGPAPTVSRQEAGPGFLACLCLKEGFSSQLCPSEFEMTVVDCGGFVFKVCLRQLGAGSLAGGGAV